MIRAIDYRDPKQIRQQEIEDRLTDRAIKRAHQICHSRDPEYFWKVRVEYMANIGLRGPGAANVKMRKG